MILTPSVRRLLIAGIPAAVLMAAGLLYAARVGGPQPPLLAAVLVAFPCLTAGALAATRLHAWLTLFVGGALTGLWSAWPLLIATDAPEAAIAGIATLGFFMGLGLILGAIAEFVLYLHHLSHGRKPLAYPPRNADDAAPKAVKAP